jgi:hypothetical protein
MIVKIGCALEHGGEKFVVVNIKQEETMDGMVLIITGFDPEMANKEQGKAIKMEQTSNQVLEMVKKLTEGGGTGFGGINFGG